ncbi:MAG: phosphatidic acid phosphatase [Clostridia bacterium]|nr:phosphatidic acid phosphatase [Clostridia bacterium]
MAKKWADRLQRYVPRYAVWPMAAWFTLNALVYWGARLINRHAVYHDLSLPIDRQLPFVSFFIVFYVLAYVSWFIGYLLPCREKPEKCGVPFADMLAKLLCFAVFIAYPTCVDRPSAEGAGVFAWMTRVIYFFDEPNTLFPSIHCLESWVIWRGMWGCRSISRPVKAFFLAFALLVFASTLLIKQHVIVDIPAAIAVGEIGLWLERRLGLGRRYARHVRDGGRTAC